MKTWCLSKFYKIQKLVFCNCMIEEKRCEVSILGELSCIYNDKLFSLTFKATPIML